MRPARANLSVQGEKEAGRLNRRDEGKMSRWKGGHGLFDPGPWICPDS